MFYYNLRGKFINFFIIILRNYLNIYNPDNFKNNKNKDD